MKGYTTTYRDELDSDDLCAVELTTAAYDDVIMTSSYRHCMIDGRRKHAPLNLKSKPWHQCTHTDRACCLAKCLSPKKVGVAGTYTNL